MSVAKCQQTASAGTCDSAWTHPRGISFLCSWSIIASDLCRPTLLWKISATGGACLASQVLGVRCGRLPLLEIQRALRPLSRCQQWLPQTHPSRDLITSVSHSPGLSPVMAAPIPLLHCDGVSRVRLFARTVPGCLVRQLQESQLRSLSFLPRYKPAQTHSPLSAAQTSTALPLVPICGLNCCSQDAVFQCNLPFPLSPSQGAHATLISFCFYPASTCIFLIALVVQALSVYQFPVSFQ